MVTVICIKINLNSKRFLYDLQQVNRKNQKELFNFVPCAHFWIVNKQQNIKSVKSTSERRPRPRLPNFLIFAVICPLTSWVELAMFDQSKWVFLRKEKRGKSFLFFSNKVNCKQIKRREIRHLDFWITGITTKN